MAWPTEAGSIGITKPPMVERLAVKRARPQRRRGFPPTLLPPPQPGGVVPIRRRILKPAQLWRAKIKRRPRRATRVPYIKLSRYRVDVLEYYRIFNAVAYRFYKSTTGPPLESDTPFASNATLPHSPADLFSADGTVYFSVSYFNGVLDSGFLPIGPNGETYLRLDLASGAAVLAPPNAPTDVRLVLRPGGVVRVAAVYLQTDALRGSEWAITYTTNGSTPGTPPAVAPTATRTISGTNLSVLEYDLPAQADGTTVKVRLQTRRNDSGTWRYSEGSTVLTAVADAVGPAAVEGAGTWRGAVPEQT